MLLLLFANPTCCRLGYGYKHSRRSFYYGVKRGCLRLGSIELHEIFGFSCQKWWESLDFWVGILSLLQKQTNFWIQLILLLGITSWLDIFFTTKLPFQGHKKLKKFKKYMVMKRRLIYWIRRIVKLNMCVCAPSLSYQT